ncbi:single-stranded DNA-binding protein [Corynebacterium aurimucosum]|uniref:single-stranded DNA-binding protein n=1 Tax=Corynebacterium aurimucosum TaxID=169292 RepID=UPI001C0ED9B5|nr:single-stranded DNA-binding protein [Corynebacterium aurimucosum]MBU5654306.1 single-stranded DNA-binding protein [Corynebacterium aurimucosum]
MAFDTITINRARVTDKGVELRTSKNGNEYASLTVMWSSSRKDKAGETEYGPTKFVKVTVTGFEAKDVFANIRPGDRVNVTGRIQHFEWQSDKGPQDDWSILGSVSLPVPYADNQQPNNAAQNGQTADDPWNAPGKFSGQQAPNQQQAQQNVQQGLGAQTVEEGNPPF